MGNLETRNVFQGFDMQMLQLDEAFLFVNSSFVDEGVELFGVSSDCFKCALRRIGSSTKDGVLAQIDTKFESSFYLRRNDSYQLCEITPSVGEFGIYEWKVESESECKWNVIKEPENIYWPLLYAVLFYLVLAFAICITEVMSKKMCKKSSTEEETQPIKKRLRSIDTFRGFSIVLMIFVNMGGGGYYFFGHATWDGFFIADIVFPCFLWIMGVCIPISIRSVLRTTKSYKKSYYKIAKRSFYLFFLGLMLGAGTNLESVRIMGVLQRFSITYFTIATLCLALSKHFEKDFKGNFQDIWRLIPHWIIIFTVIIIHTTLTFCLPVPGCPMGYIGAGGDHLNRSYPNCTGGSAGYVDRVVLGVSHLYSKSTIKNVYHSYWSYEPEGILSTLTSCVQVFLGVQAGSILLTFPLAKHRIVRWSCWGAVCGVLGLLLCQAKLSDGWIPVNKNLWSLSFVLVTSSFSFFFLSLLYFLIDVRGWWMGSPFYYPGMNAIILYCGHMIGWNFFPFVWQLNGNNTHALQLASHLWTTSAWVLISFWLYRIKFFLAL